MSNKKSHVEIDLVLKLHRWIEGVEKQGIEEMMKIPGFHDEPLKGDRVGQRSIRLNRDYRAIYIRINEKEITIIKVIKVSKHEY